MELLHLHYFQEIARLESVTQAAAELHISQPALSKILSRLEQELGQKLFDRRNRQMHLTLAGRLFLQHVHRVFLELHDARKELDSLSGAADTAVIVAASSSRLLPNLLTTYLRAYPQGRFQLRQITELPDMEKELLEEKINFCLSFEPLRHRELATHKLAREDIFLAVAQNHPLAGREFVDFAELRQEKFISLTSECGLRELTGSCCEQAGFQPDVQFEINSLEVIANLVNAGLGIAFLPAFWREYKRGIGPVQIPLKRPSCYRTIWISQRKKAVLSNAQKKFLLFVRQYFASHAVRSAQ